jgi:enoyl-[acyl-carrier protein] reductase III
VSTAQVVPVMNDLNSGVREIFAQVTRYPLEVLDPTSGLEEDLGIDSVKLGEVFAVLREKYGLPEKMDIPREKLKTIGGIAEALQEYLRGTQVTASAHEAFDRAEEPAATRHAGANGFGDSSALQAGVLEIFAQVTRYPLEVLDTAAGLEEDLGIDSVKLGEVFAVLREKYGLPEKMDIPREKLKTIGGIADSLYDYLSQREGVPVVVTRPASPAPVIPGGNGSGLSESVVAESFAMLSPERKPFAGKIALVTGSGRGLGKDVATYLSELGASVIVNSFHSRPEGEATVEQIKAKGGDAIHAWGSVANPDHVNAIFEQIESTYGGLDFFVSNASNGMLARLKDITPEHWEKAFRTNVVGLHQTSLRAVELMKKRGGGKVITLSSPASHGYVDYFGCMGAVKAAVESLTKSMAIEFSVDNIQVNCVSPGPIYGDLLNKWPESERLIARWEDATVYERLCVDRDVSHFIAYLLSEPVRLFAGSVLVMDGGISVRWG